MLYDSKIVKDSETRTLLHLCFIPIPKLHGLARENTFSN